MGNLFSKHRPRRPIDTGASSPTPSKRPRPDALEESLLPLPSSDSLEKINVPSASGANSGPFASSTSVIGNNWYVFLSFRGADTRNGFVDHLYHRLKDVGLPFHPNFVFRDDEDLPFGEIGENHINAIKHSKVSIPVISEKYAGSECCLRELIHIMECKESGGQIVLPVLYKVKLHEVRELKGAFGKAFKSSMRLLKKDVKQQGPEALRKALDLRVYESEKFAHGREGVLVKELVDIIMRQQQDDFPPCLPTDLVGIDDKQSTVLTPSSSSEMGGQHEDAKAPALSTSVSLTERESESCTTMEDRCLTRQLKRAGLTEALTLTISKPPRPDILEESPLLLPSWESLEKINVPSESGANSGPFASSTSVIGNNWYVFLSFRGADTRNGFVDHLYHRLKDVGLPFHPNFVFRDDEDLPFGEIGENHINAIKHSKVSISVISENYAASEWCLCELIQIMECVERGEQKVLPVLYKVRPYEVRERKGAFGKAFKSSMRLLKKDVKQQGPEALRKALDLKVYESEKFAHGREGELVKELVDMIMRQQQDDFPPSLPMDLVGIDDKETTVLTPSSSSKMGGQHEDGKAPASSPSVIGNNYSVFLSFRGPDTPKGFVHGLYNRLKDVGLRFHPNFLPRDDNDLPFGEDVAANLTSVITHSKVSIPVISPNYAASEWCLRELIHIMECKESRGQIVLPVLYKVKPKDVKHMQGKFGEAFESSMDRFDEKVKQQGPEALRKAVDLRVLEIEKFADGREGELVKELVDIIMRQQQDDFPPSLPTDLVGIDDQVAGVRKLVDTAYPDTRIIGIYGIGGIGKTTLATIIYNQLVDKFTCRSFLKDIRETINSKGIEHVQSRLISDILKFHDYRVLDSHTGIRAIQSSCKEKKVLILLDDVDRKDHLDSLIGGCSFKAGSRIIVTCRDKAMLESKYGYEVKEMNREDSLLLFSRHAFGGKPPPKDLATLSHEIVATTGGLPLALMFVGSLLKGKEDQRVWKEMLKKLRNMPSTTVRQKLRMSYDTLEHEEQQMFLDIACFFVGTDKRIASYYWDDLEYFPISELAKMLERSLIKYNDNNELRMHDQLRDLGRSIACPVDKKPWDCSRLWDKEAMAVLQSEENRNIEALRLDKNGSSKFMEQGIFKILPKLKFLHVNAVDFAGHWEESLCELRWLKWESCPHSFEATSVHLENLLIFDLSGGKIRDNWKGWGSIKMERLKVLNLSSCSDLKTTPRLSAFKSLKMLVLENCENLEEIDPSIGDVKCLVSLNLRYCVSVKKLPAQLGELKELEELLIDETNIQEIPPFIGSLKKLKMLSAVGCGLLTQIPSSISYLVNLSTLNLTTCKTLQELGSFKALGKLQRLCLGCCYRLKQIPSSIGELKKLVELDLSYTRIKELPESIEKLKNLKILRIRHSEIEKLPSSIGQLESLQELDALGCHKLEGQILRDISRLSSLRTLHLSKAKISHLPENFRELTTLDHLDLLYCSELESLPAPPSGLSYLQLTCRSNTLPLLSHLSHLKELTLHCCMFLESIPELPSNIRKLRVWKCPKLKTLPNLSNLRSLMELELLQCYGVMEFNGLEALQSLTKLDVSTSIESPNLDDFEELEELELWTNLDLRSYDEEADNLHELQGTSHLKSLEVLNISARKHIRRLDLSKSEHLKRLIVNNCESLVEIRCHDKIESLEHFDRNGCDTLRILPDFLASDRS